MFAMMEKDENTQLFTTATRNSNSDFGLTKFPFWQEVFTPA
jgi:hypothetical protein